VRYRIGEIDDVDVTMPASGGDNDERSGCQRENTPRSA
jgi:hypothetical protein